MEQGDLKNWKYVVMRRNKYGLRVPIPLELKAILGKGPITRSLGTGDLFAREQEAHAVVNAFGLPEQIRQEDCNDFTLNATIDLQR